MICIRFVSFKYVINGKHSDFLQAKRGLSQEDPISPQLFVLILEYLHRCSKKLQENHNFNYHPRCERMQITNICFGDDIILFSRGDEMSVQLLMTEFQHFTAATGLQANPTKSEVNFGGVNGQVRQKILEATKRITLLLCTHS